jgi:hypothetical protein
MELNPTNPVVMQAHGQWHKIAAMIMVKLGVTELQIDHEDVLKVAQGNVNIVLDARGERANGFITIRIVDDKTAHELAKL